MTDVMKAKNFNPINQQINMPALTEQEAKQVYKAYSDMFTALTYTNLLQKKSLGQSWFNANQQIQSFIQTKNKYNSVTAYMDKILNNHRKDLAKQMMTHPNRDKVIQVTPQQREKMTTQLNEAMKSAMQTINTLIEKYREKADKLKAQIEAQEKARQEKMLAQQRQIAEKLQQQMAQRAQQQSAQKPKTASTAPAKAANKPVRPARPAVSNPVQYQAMKQRQASIAKQAQTKSAPAKAPVKFVPQISATQKRTVAQFASAQQKLNALKAQKKQIQLFLINQNQRQNYRSA